jgi:hypothetical protein
MSRDRGVRAQNWLAAYLAGHGFPHAESTGSGRRGSDVQGTPGIVWENKAAREFRPAAWVAQARSHARSFATVAVTVYWPVGVGERGADAAMAILSLPELVALLRAAGYGEPDMQRARAAFAQITADSAEAGQ